MDEVPVIIHRLSQRLWVPEYREKEDQELVQRMQDSTTVEKPVDPLASPPQDPVDVSGNILDANQIASLSLDSGSETHALFSQKNLLRLSALTDSHRTLSLFTPSIRDAVFRAWAGPSDHGERYGTSGRATPVTPAMTRSHSYTGNTSTTYSFAETPDAGPSAVRPALSSFASAATGLSGGLSKHGKLHGGRKKKHRVVNLRKKATTGDDLESVSGESSTASGTVSSAPSERGVRPRTPENRERDELVTPPSTPERSQEKEPGDDTPLRLRNPTPLPRNQDLDATPRASMYDTSTAGRQTRPGFHSEQLSTPHYPSSHSLPQKYFDKKTGPVDPCNTQSRLQHIPPTPYIEPQPEGIQDQTWMTKMAREIARKVQDQKAADSGFWDRHDREEAPPPAYES